MPLASLAQTTDSNAPTHESPFKHYPLGQVLYFHEARLKKLEDEPTAKETAELEVLTKKVEHLEKMCQRLHQTVVELKTAQVNMEANIELEIGDEN